MILGRCAASPVTVRYLPPPRDRHRKGATMLFAVFDHNDATGLPAARQLDERLELIAAYERLGFYAYQMAEHHGTPLGIATPHLMLAAASRLTSVIRLGTLISILPV